MLLNCADLLERDVGLGVPKLVAAVGDLQICYSSRPCCGQRRRCLSQRDHYRSGRSRSEVRPVGGRLAAPWKKWSARVVAEGPELITIDECGLGLKLIDHRRPDERVGKQTVNEQDGNLPGLYRVRSFRGGRHLPALAGRRKGSSQAWRTFSPGRPSGAEMSPASGTTAPRCTFNSRRGS